MAQNHLKLGENPPFCTFFNVCVSIIFLWAAAQGLKSSFFNPKLGARFYKKNMGLRGPKCTHKKFIDEHIRRRGDQVYIPRAC